MEQRSLTVPTPVLAEDDLGFFRWSRMAGKVLITNDAGDWVFLTDAEFNDLLAGRVTGDHLRFHELQSKGFLREGLDLDALVARIARRNRHVGRGPLLHVVNLTQRSSQAVPNGSAAEHPDMNVETAEAIVDFALQSSSPSITFEFVGQGGEPLLNFDVLRHFVELAVARNKRSAEKTLTFWVRTNLSAVTEAIAEWLIANDVHVSTSLDGPAAIHDWNRKWKSGSSHADVARWIGYFQRRYAELGRDPRQGAIDALITVSRPGLNAWREIVDEYVALGLRTLHLRPLSPAGLAAETWAEVGYTADEYLAFYRRALDYMLELNRKGVEINERMAAVFLGKILGADDSGVVDILSPSGEGTAQVAYNFDGRIFPSDDARRVDAMGDPLFELGRVGSLTIADMLRHTTVRAIAAASLLDAQPMCAECWNKPFCGVSPVFNFMTQGDLFAQRPHSVKCKEHMFVSGRLFELLANQNDSETSEILKRWATPTAYLASNPRASTEAP